MSSKPPPIQPKPKRLPENPLPPQSTSAPTPPVSGDLRLSLHHDDEVNKATCLAAAITQHLDQLHTLHAEHIRRHEAVVASSPDCELIGTDFDAKVISRIARNECSIVLRQESERKSSDESATATTHSLSESWPATTASRPAHPIIRIQRDERPTEQQLPSHNSGQTSTIATLASNAFDSIGAAPASLVSGAASSRSGSRIKELQLKLVEQMNSSCRQLDLSHRKLPERSAGSEQSPEEDRTSSVEKMRNKAFSVANELFETELSFHINLSIIRAVCFLFSLRCFLPFLRSFTVL